MSSLQASQLPPLDRLIETKVEIVGAWKHFARETRFGSEKEGVLYSLPFGLFAGNFLFCFLLLTTDY